MPLQKQVDKGMLRTRIIVCGVSVVLILITSLSLWLKNNVFDSQQFATQIRQSLQEEDVRQAIGNRVADKLYENNPIAGRVLSQPTASVVASTLGRERISDASEKIFERLNQRIINGNNEPVEIDLTGFVSTVQGLRLAINPNADLKLPEGAEAKITLIPATSLPNLKGLGQWVLFLTPFSAISLAILTLLALIKSRNKWNFVILAGLTVTISMLILLTMAYTAATQLSLAAQNADQAVILQSLFGSFTSNLQHYAQLLLGLGILTVLVGYIGKNWKKIRSWMRAARKQDRNTSKSKS